jgi:hypothetical protein
VDIQTLTHEEVIERVMDIIDAKTYLRKTNEENFEGDIDADYRDELEHHTIKKLFKSDNPRDALFELLSEGYMGCEWEYKKEVIETVEKHFDDDDRGIFYSDYEDDIRDWIDEHVFFNYPYRHYLDQDVYVDIIADTGDGNYDYTMNELFGCIYSKKGYREESSVTWLMKQQGYSEAQIMEFIENENFQGSKLLKSIYTECLNTTTCTNALTFFVKMTVEECFDLHEALNDKENAKKTITISKDSPCGLYDPWNGAGSVLEITLEKDVVLPFEYVDSAYPDGCRGYSVGDIYGMMQRFWDNGSVKIA